MRVVGVGRSEVVFVVGLPSSDLTRFLVRDSGSTMS